MAGTSLGLINDTLNEDRPPNGTIFEALNTYGISWKNYFSTSPSALIWLYQAGDPKVTSKLVKSSEFFTDAAAGTLPAFSLVDPNFSTGSEENPQDVQVGDQFLSQVVNAVMTSPQWPGPCWCGPMTNRAATTTTSRRPRRSSRTRWRPLAAEDHPGAFNRYGFGVPVRSGVAVCPTQLRLERGPRPHLDPQAGRDQVEPAGADLPRPERRQPARLRRPDQSAGLPDPADAAAAVDPTLDDRVPVHGAGHHPAAGIRHHQLRVRGVFP